MKTDIMVRKCVNIIHNNNISFIILFSRITHAIHSFKFKKSVLSYLSNLPPLTGSGAGTPQLLGQQVGRRCFHQLFQHLLHDAKRPVSSRHIET